MDMKKLVMFLKNFLHKKNYRGVLTMQKINKYIINHIKETSETGYKQRMFIIKEIICFLLFLGIIGQLIFIFLIMP